MVAAYCNLTGSTSSREAFQEEEGQPEGKEPGTYTAEILLLATDLGPHNPWISTYLIAFCLHKRV